MERNSKILVTGAAGMVGRALVAKLRQTHMNVVGLTRKDCDLEDRQAVHRVFSDIKPEYVFHIAAKVGGIKANMSDPVSFLKSNLLLQTHVIEASYECRVEKFLFLGSSCIYPRECPQPMKEEYLLTGPLEPTNEGYALAKIAGLRLTQYYSRQSGWKVSIPLPCNVYGPGDSFNLEHCHVLSALVKRFVDARESRASTVTLWGTGAAKREFIHVDDLTDGILFAMTKTDTPEILNLGTGVDYSIRELAQMVGELAGYKGEILWDISKPDGMPRKCLDVSKMAELGFRARMPIADGIKGVIADYESQL
jgi:GDP-L-fucose synthase